MKLKTIIRKEIYNLYHNIEHKKIMLLCLYAVAIIIYAFLSIVFAYEQKHTIFFIKFCIFLILILLLIYYLKSNKTKLFATILLIITEFDIAYAIIDGYIFNHLVTYAFIYYSITGLYVFGFFFFYGLRYALLASILHYIFWILITLSGYYIFYIDSLGGLSISLSNMFLLSFVILIFNLIYYFSTVIPYEKLEEDDKVKESLLNEIHHRIKNNLNMMASIIGLQIMGLKNDQKKDPVEILTDSKLRIEAIAMIHESLYADLNFEKIDFREYTQNLTTLIKTTYNKFVSIKIDSNVTLLPMDNMFRLGIIINELFTNSIKYAFKDNKTHNEISISLMQEQDELCFKYHEKSLHDIDIQKILNSETLGIKLVKLTVQQMGANLEVSQEDGLIFTIKL